MPKRKPISYETQFAPGVFRSPDEVASELEALEEEGSSEELPSSPVSNLDTKLLRPTQEFATRPSDRSNERTNEQHMAPRMRVRHSFDIWEDQLLSLAAIQADRFAASRRKPKLGELVQEALDAYIREHNAARNERPNIRTNERIS